MAPIEEIVLDREHSGRDWCLTLHRAPFPREAHPCRLRILRPHRSELPRSLREAATRAGITISQRGGRPILEGDGKALSALSSDLGAPLDFRETLQRTLERSGRRQFNLPLHRGRQLQLGDPPAIFGVINVTPDSFSDGGVNLDPGKALESALGMVEAGADAIDVGGESSRPGSTPVPAEEEIRRIQLVLREIRNATDIPLSIDTTKADVARMALDEGADIINDVSALRDDPDMISVARDSGVPLIILHRRGTSRDMQDDPRYDDVVGEVYEFLEGRIQWLERAGISREKVMVDPGIGFGKRLEHNLALIRDVSEFCSLGRPVMIGASRKTFLGNLLGAPVDARETGTLTAHAAAILGGAAAVRVHQVSGHRDMIRVLWAIVRPPAGGGG